MSIINELKPYDVLGKLTYGKLYNNPDLPIHYYFFRYHTGFIVLGGTQARKTLVSDWKRVKTKKAKKELLYEFCRKITTVDNDTRFTLCGRISSMFLDSEAHLRIFGSEDAIVVDTHVTE